MSFFIYTNVLKLICSIIRRGKLIGNCNRQSLKIIFDIIQYATLVHVNSFVILSGYYQSDSKFKFSKLIKMIFQVIFYLIIITVVCIKIGWIQTYNLPTFVNNILPSSICNY